MPGLDLLVIVVSIGGAGLLAHRFLLGIVPARAPDADAPARALGAVTQLTSIPRDLREDARAGRAYLLDDGLERAGVRPGEVAGVAQLNAGRPGRRAAAGRCRR
jgi:phytoene/squalene synthetase